LKTVFLCGDESTVKAAAQQFKRRSQLDVRPVRPGDVQATWQLSGDAAEFASAPALGGLLLSYLPADECDAPNLMQHILEGRQEPLRPRLLRCMMPVAATLVVAAMLSLFTSRQRSGLDEMQVELGNLAVEEARARELRLQLTGSEAKLQQLKLLAGQLPADLGGDSVSRLAGCMPSDVWLSNLMLTDRTTARLQGLSYLEAGVYDFVRWLELAPGIAEVALKRTSATASPSGPATSFELELILANFADEAPRVARHENFASP
jgi:hypothetical protein